MPASHALPNRPVNVLLVGTEQMLLYTRKVILEKERMIVSVAKPVDAVDRMRNFDFDVVITCHTLRSEEAEQVVKAARTKTHVPGLICFSKQPSLAATTPAFFDASVWSLSAPNEFLQRVFAVLPSEGDGTTTA